MPVNMNVDNSEYECECTEPRVYRLTFDGGSSGNYVVEYCQKCYNEDDKQFLLSMGVIS